MVETVMMIPQIPFSTDSGEQGNAPLALMSREHPGYLDNILLARAVLHASRALLREEMAPYLAKSKAIEDQIAREEAKTKARGLPPRSGRGSAGAEP